MKKRIVVLTGAGISAESGVKTFRDHDGLWEGHKIEEVASTIGWHVNRDNMLEFYNQRRAQLTTVHPNGAHDALKDLETDFEVHIITQNVDDLHERAGSSNILHLHGELSLACSSLDKTKTVPYPIEGIKIGDKHEDGSQLRPFIVWFGENVPKYGDAIKTIKLADVVVIVGTSLAVSPANMLVDYAPMADFYIVDQKIPEEAYDMLSPGTIYIEKKATEGCKELAERLRVRYINTES